MLAAVGVVVLLWLLIKQPIFVFRMGLFAVVIVALALGVGVAVDSKPTPLPIVDTGVWEE